MRRRYLVLTMAILVISAMFASPCAAEKEGFGTKIKNFWINLLSYPARVTEESASVLADTTKNGINVVTNEIERVAEVAAGDVAKTKELITEPITGTAETAVKAAEDVIKIPSEAANEDKEAPAAETSQ